MATTQADLLSIFDNMEDGICIINDDHIIEYMNSSMVRIFGDETGKKCHEVIHKCERACQWCASRKVFEGETTRFQCFLEHFEKTYEVVEVPLKTEKGEKSKLIGIWRDVTESKRHEEKIKASEKDYRRLFEHVGCGVYVSSKEGKFLNANRALLNMLGYESKEEFLKIDIAQDLYLRPGDRRIYQKMIERLGHVIDYEVDFKSKKGNPIPVSLTSHVRYDQEGKVLGYEGIIVDLSQRKAMEKELEEAHDFLNKIILSSPNAIMATDMRGNIIIWNQGAEEILGYKASELIGKMNVAGIYQKGMAKKVMKMMRSPEYGGIGKLRSYPIVFLRKDGEPVEGNFSAAILYDSEGKEIASVGIFVDLKDRLEMEHKLRNTQEQLFQSEKLASIGRLAAGVAHELNNPLAAIMLYSHLVLEDLAKDDLAFENQKKVVIQADRCKKIVEGLLDFSRQREPETKPLDVNQIIEDTLSLVEIQSLFQNIEIIKTLDPILPSIMGDKSQLQQVFMNLAINAAEAMRDGGELIVETALNNGFVEIRFADTGCGLPQGEAEKIFEPFFTTKSDQGGTGLGLALSHGIINKHGGTITFDTRLNEGSTFCVRLPITEEQP